MRTVIGVDAGGTTTRAVLVDENGSVLGSGRSGTGNPTSAGAERALANLTEAAIGAWTDGGSPAAPEMVVVCGAGVRAAGYPEAFEQLLAVQGPSVPSRFFGDILGAYCSATAEPDGYVMVAGTGATAGRIRGGQIVEVADGLGWLLGDCGSGFWLGREVVRAVGAQLGGYGPVTALTPLVIDRMPDTSDPLQPWRDPGLHKLLSWIYSVRPVEISTLAPLASAAAGDPVADAIVARAAELIVTSLSSVVRDDPGPIVLTGGVLGPGPIADAVAARWPGRCLLASDGSSGAALLALREAGLSSGPAVLARIKAGLVSARF